MSNKEQACCEKCFLPSVGGAQGYQTYCKNAFCPCHNPREKCCKECTFCCGQSIQEHAENGCPGHECHKACCTKCAIFGRNNEPPHAYDVPMGCSHIHCPCHKACCDKCKCPDSCDQPGTHCRFIKGGVPQCECHSSPEQDTKRLNELIEKAVTGKEPEQKDKNGHKIGADGKLVFDALCEGCDAPEQKKCEKMCCRVDDKGFHYHTCSYAAESGECIYCGRQLYKAPEQEGWDGVYGKIVDGSFPKSEQEGKPLYTVMMEAFVNQFVGPGKMVSPEYFPAFEDFITDFFTKAEQAAVAEERERVKDLLESKIIYKEDIELPIKGQTERLIRGLAKNELIQDLLSALSNTDK